MWLYLCNEGVELPQIYLYLWQSGTNRNQLRVAKTYRNLFIKIGLFATPKDYQRMYEALQKGDPKLRSYCALYQIIYSQYIEDAKAERKGVEAHG